tara:strand:- start:340 stop:471 length:132 start_codon:yes stop_codon:yes gene_type:complete
MGIDMSETKQLRKEIELLSGEINSLKDVIQTLTKNVSKKNNRL